MLRPCHDFHRTMQCPLVLFDRRAAFQWTRRLGHPAPPSHDRYSQGVRSFPEILHLLVQHQRRDLHQLRIREAMSTIPAFHLPVNRLHMRPLPTRISSHRRCPTQKRRVWRVPAKVNRSSLRRCLHSRGQQVLREHVQYLAVAGHHLVRTRGHSIRHVRLCQDHITGRGAVDCSSGPLDPQPVRTGSHCCPLHGNQAHRRTMRMDQQAPAVPWRHS